jgi:hypothetical protein
VTKDAADYKKVLGVEPDPGVVMAAVAELSFFAPTQDSLVYRLTILGSPRQINELGDSLSIGPRQGVLSAQRFFPSEIPQK